MSTSQEINQSEVKRIKQQYKEEIEFIEKTEGKSMDETIRLDFHWSTEAVLGLLKAYKKYLLKK